MEIAHITSECAPFAKVGGLADVVIGLSKELVNEGHVVDIFIPHYPFAEHHLPPICPLEESFEFWFGKEKIITRISKTIYEGINIYLVQLESISELFSRERIYGYEDDARRFIAFTKAVIELFEVLKKNYTAIHVHDWPTAIAPILFEEIPRKIQRPRFILTVHNLSYQGITSYDPLEEAGLFSPKACKFLEDLYIPYRFNLLLGGLRAADHITTVSPTYAKEIATIELGRGLHEIFLKRSHQFTGILNGLDPLEIERYIEINEAVKSRSLQAILQLKEKMKQKLAQEFQLDTHSNTNIRPWFLSVTRLADQKAPLLIYEAAKTVLTKGGIFILFGSDGDLSIRDLFINLEKEWSHTKRVKIVLEYNPKLAEQSFAAADFCVIPSYFEPCGLTQLYSFYFATLPIVHKTGGLADTVFDEDDPRPMNGYTFNEPEVTRLNHALERALNEFHSSKFLTRQKNSAAFDISWKHAVHDYLKVYRS